MPVSEPPRWRSLFAKAPSVVCYHKNCQDGWAAAVVAHLRFGDGPEYVYCQYGEPLPPAVLLGGESVLFLDFCPTKEQLDNHVIPRWKQWFIVDHHESQRWILEYPEENHYFELDWCGAMLTWRLLFPETPPPPVLSYVQDRDLWSWALPHAKEVDAGLDDVPRTFGAWRDLFANPHCVRELEKAGRPIYATLKRIFEGTANKARLIHLNRVPVRMVNNGTLISEVCNHILNTKDDVDIAICYFYLDPETVIVSARARKGSECLPLIKSLQSSEFPAGGGHAAAGSCKLTVTEFYSYLGVE